MALRAGQLRERVTIQTATTTRANSGSVSQSWADTATVWARVEFDGDLTTEAASSHEEQRRYIVTMRHRSLSVEQRIKWTDRNSVEHIMEIVSIDTYEDRGSRLVVRCVEVAE